MYAFCALMVDPTKDVDIYFEQACALYLSRSKLPAFALRATMLQYEAIKLTDNWSAAANGLIRCSSDLEDDYLGALLLEQAAYCYLKAPVPKARKFSFFMILAGHRFIRCKQVHLIFSCLINKRLMSKEIASASYPGLPYRFGDA